MPAYRSWISRLALLAGLIVAFSGTTRADQVFNVSFDTSSLAGSTLSFVFDLTNGGTAGDNTSVVSNFAFGGGSLDPLAPVTIGTVSADDPLTSVTLVDSAVLNSYQKSFTAGSFLSFQVSLTTNIDLDPNAFPDTFAFYILDSMDSPLPTSDPLTGSALLIAEITSDTSGPTAIIDTFPVIDPNNPTGPPVIGAPTVTTVNAIPEPSTLASASVLLLVLGVRFLTTRRV